MSIGFLFIIYFFLLLNYALLNIQFLCFASKTRVSEANIYSKHLLPLIIRAFLLRSQMINACLTEFLNTLYFSYIRDANT